MKYVYLIQSLENSYYKIGISKHPQKRLRENQTGNPSPTKLIDVYESEIANKIERILQRRYSYAKRQSEWFDLLISIEVTFKKECKQIEENLILLDTFINKD
jgi:predicted GIY-YIG superfamily endonuclease